MFTAILKIVGPSAFTVTSRKSAREGGIDAFRALGALGVIQLHFGAWRGALWPGTDLGDLSTALSFVARMAVPFFFVTSGYLLARRGEPGTLAPAAWGQVRRILSLFATWSVIALAFRGVLRAVNRRSPWAVFEPLASFLHDLQARPIEFLLRGPEEHLWFLPALCAGIALYVAMDAAPWLRRLRPFIAGLIGLLGLAAGSYGLLSLPVTLNPRSGPFLAFPLVTLGAVMAGRPRMRSTVAWVGVLSGFVLTGLEASWLSQRQGASWTSHDALLGFFVTGPFLLGLARRSEGTLIARMAVLGRMTLGVYACHTLVAVLVIDAARRLGDSAPPAALLELVAFGLIAFLSFGLASLLSRFPSTRRLVQ